MVRYTLKFLFMYKGWLYERRGSKVSIKTKIWMILVRIFSTWNKPKLYSLQGSIPKLPLPSLNDTLTKVCISITLQFSPKLREIVLAVCTPFARR